MTPYEVGSILERGANTPTGKLELYSERIAAHPEWGLDALPTYRPPYNPDPEQYPFLLCAGTRIPNALHSRLHDVPWERSLLPVVSGISDAITHSCCLTAMDLNASAILAATRSGYTAKVISRFRPACPIVALCQNESTRRQLAISWGVHPYLSGEVDSTDRMFSLAVDVARKENAVQIGDTVVITAGVPLGQSGTTNLIKAQIVEGGL